MTEVSSAFQEHANTLKKKRTPYAENRTPSVETHNHPSVTQHQRIIRLSDFHQLLYWRLYKKTVSETRVSCNGSSASFV